MTSGVNFFFLVQHQGLNLCFKKQIWVKFMLLEKDFLTTKADLGDKDAHL
jgi:hypothetical protein